MAIISTSVAKVQRVQRQEDVDAVGLAADAGHQVAGALAAEVVERQAQQVLEGGGAQVGPDALRHQRQHVGAWPSPAPSHQGRRQQAGQQHQHHAGVDGWPFWNGIRMSSISGMVR
jgi:hypothetical protein